MAYTQASLEVVWIFKDGIRNLEINSPCLFRNSGTDQPHGANQCVPPRDRQLVRTIVMDMKIARLFYVPIKHHGCLEEYVCGVVVVLPNLTNHLSELLLY